MNHSHRQPTSGQVVQVSRSDRWQAYQRLQELSICCNHTQEGFLLVDVSNLVEILQVRSVIQQLTVPRPVLAEWLEQCWSAR